VFMSKIEVENLFKIVGQLQPVVLQIAFPTGENSLKTDEKSGRRLKEGRAAKSYLVWPCMSWYRYFVVAATSVAVLLGSGSRHFGMAWRSSGSSNAQLVENLQGNLVLFTCCL